MGNVKTIRRNLLLVAVGAFVAGALVGSTLFSAPAEAQAEARYNYLHFRAGSCVQGNVQGLGVIDLRNGNAWCVPAGGGAPAFEGTLNLAAVPERAPAGR